MSSFLTPLARIGAQLASNSAAIPLPTRVYAQIFFSARSITYHQPTRCSHTAASYSRERPDAPRVGLGVTVLRATEQGTEVLLVQRAKPPNMGEWCIPGGGLELGETLAQCAVREVKEETGLDIAASESPYSRRLDAPTAFTAVDVITHDENNELGFHYAIIEMAARPLDPDQPVVFGDDASGAKWVLCSTMDAVENITPDVPRVVRLALSQFDV